MNVQTPETVGRERLLSEPSQVAYYEFFRAYLVKFNILPLPEKERIFGRIISAIKAQTDYFSMIRRSDLVDIFLEGKEKVDKIGTVKVVWDSWLIKLLHGEGTGGVSNPFLFPMIITNDTPPTLDTIINDLVMSGRFSKSISALIHEYTHQIQFSQFKRLFGLIKYFVFDRFKNNKAIDALAEVHAKFSENGWDFIHSSNIDHYLENFAKSYDLQIDHVRYSFFIVHIFMELGYSDEEISKIIQNPGKWDNKRKVFINLEERLDSLLRPKLTNPDNLNELIGYKDMLREKVFSNADRMRENYREVVSITRNIIAEEIDKLGV